MVVAERLTNYLLNQSVPMVFCVANVTKSKKEEQVQRDRKEENVQNFLEIGNVVDVVLRSRRFHLNHATHQILNALIVSRKVSRSKYSRVACENMIV